MNPCPYPRISLRILLILLISMDGQIRYLANGVVDLIVVTQFTILKRPLIFYLGEEKRFERTSEFSHSGPRAKSVALGQPQVRCLANLIVYVFNF